MLLLRTVALLAALAAAPALRAQLSETAAWSAYVANQFRVVPNITYLTANNWDAKLDVYTPRDAAGPVPTLIYIHGGGWTGGSKESSILSVVPYLELGWAVVNVEYRLARVSLAPAAVEDCLCALRWVIRNAKEYNFDVGRLVLTGHSAGGHLSLTTGIMPPEVGLDRQCPGSEPLKVAAIVNWYGITDVPDLLEGPHRQVYAVTWLSSLENRQEVAARVSPLRYIRPGLPPVLTIHGDADTTVPYSHAVRLHEALQKAGVPNQLLTIPGGKHGGFSRPEMVKIHLSIRDFLAQHKVLSASGTSRGGAR
jgi:acetyl esterase/lipase